MVEPIIKGPKYTEVTKSLKPAEERPIKGGEPAQRLPTFNIIRSVLSEELEPAEVREFVNALTSNCKKRVCQLIQIGNTVFIVNYLNKDGQLMPPRTVEFYPLSVEPEQLASRLSVFPNTLKELGFHAAISYLDDLSDLEELRLTGVPMNITQEMVFDGGEMTPMYKVELRLV